MPKELVARSSQHVCDHVREVVTSLLYPDELRQVGDFYFGLTDENQFSASIDPVGDSYLVPIHRRMFNAFQFVADVKSILRLSNREQLLGEYLHRSVTSSSHLAKMPSRPPYLCREEASYAASINCSLLRFVLCHELGHQFQKLPPAHKYRRQFPKVNTLPISWQTELIADYFGACIPMRLENPEERGASNYVEFTLSAPFVFHNLMRVVEQLRTQTKDTDSRNAENHPPSDLRASSLAESLSVTYQERGQFIVNEAYHTEDFFDNVLEFAQACFGEDRCDTV